MNEHHLCDTGEVQKKNHIQAVNTRLHLKNKIIENRGEETAK